MREGVIVLFVACGIDERYRAFWGLGSEVRHKIALFLQLGPVPPLKSLPSSRLMAESGA
jgi:hypothetical protein